MKTGVLRFILLVDHDVPVPGKIIWIERDRVIRIVSSEQLERERGAAARLDEVKRKAEAETRAKEAEAQAKEIEAHAKQHELLRKRRRRRTRQGSSPLAAP